MASPKSRDIRGFRWSKQIGSIAGIPIRVHVTLLFLLVWIALSYWLRGVGPTATLAGIVLVTSVFVIVLLHELSHALVARMFGVGTRDILLLPIGGIASLERIPDQPRRELAIAVVGPAFNLVLAGLLWIALRLAGGTADIGATTSIPELLVAQLIWINVVLAIFNLIPAFPTDGGRAFRALLAVWMPRDKATGIASAVGRALAIALGIFGLFYNPWLTLIAVVIWFGARRELDMMELRRAIANIPASAAMRGGVETVHASDSLESAASLAIATGSPLPIIADGRPVGVLTERDIAEGISAVGPEAPIAAAPHHDAVTVSPTDSLERVLDQLHAEPDAVAIVVDDGVPIGILTTEQLATFAAVSAGRSYAATR